MDDDHTDKAKDTIEVNEIHEWNKAALDKAQEYEFQAEINEVYQWYGKYPPTDQFRPQRPFRFHFQGDKFQQNRNSRFTGNCFGNHRQYTARHQSTTVANQAYTFNSTTTHPNVSYGPGALNMWPMHQSWGNQFPTNQYQPYSNQYGNQQQTPTFNSFTQATVDKTPGRPRLITLTQSWIRWPNYSTASKLPYTRYKGTGKTKHRVMRLRPSDQTTPKSRGRDRVTSQSGHTHTPHTSNETECPLTTNNTDEKQNEPNNNSHQVVPQTVSSKIDPVSHTNQVK